MIIVSHYTRISLSSTGVLLLLQTCYCYRCFFTLHLSCSLVNCIAVHCNAVYHTTHTQCIAVHCDKECNTQGSNCRSATGATASFTLHCLFSLQSIVTNSNTLQSSALQSSLVHFSFRFRFSLRFNAVENGAVELPAVLLRDLPSCAKRRSLAFQQDEQICTESKSCVRKLAKSLIIRIICK